MDISQFLYIGVHGLAGSGKDTFSKMLALLLNNNFSSKEEFKSEWETTLKEVPGKLATFNSKFTLDNNNKCVCIAFADQLKHICSNIFGIPVERFYFNKGNGWVAVNKDFQYTENKPYESQIISAEDFYTGHDKYSNSIETYYMSLREILVYVGTYVLQKDINKNTFVNIVKNKVDQCYSPNLKYVIVTDIRFEHEFDFIKKNHGITIDVFRDSVEQMDNIAEHELDDFDMYDIEIDNSGSYDDLVDIVWDFYINNIELKNDTIQLDSRDHTNNFLRVINKSENTITCKLCSMYGSVRISYQDNEILFIDPTGGPLLAIGTDILFNNEYYNINKIIYDEDKHFHKLICSK